MNQPAMQPDTGPLNHSADSAGVPLDWRALLAMREVGVGILLLLTIAVVTFINPAFLTPVNLLDMLVKASPTIIIACGVTLVIVTGEIDISVGSLSGLCAAMLGVLTSTERLGWSPAAGIFAILLLGTGVGLLNGVLVTIGRVPSIIVTLGMLTALRGITELLVGQTWIQGIPDSVRFLGRGAIAGVPVSVLVAAAVVVAFIILTRSMPLGRRIYAVGSNVRSAHLAGVSQQKIKIVVFALTGLLTAIATLVSATQLQVINTSFGKGNELLVVTCVVVGGTSISGGKGSIAGTLLGVLLLSSVSTVLIFMKLGTNATYWERAIHGGFILAAVLIDHLTSHPAAGEGHGR
jgi:ribose/xylose/arabinose/galactoside ABC-type transport system permease subunit